MIARLSSIPPLHISLAALVAGLLLIISGYVPFAILGAVLILFSFLLPFLRLGIKPNPPVVPPARPAKTETTVAARPAAEAAVATVTLPNADEAVRTIEDVLSVPLEMRDITVDQVDASSGAGGGVRIVLLGNRDGMTREMIEARYRQIRASSGGRGSPLSGSRREESA